MPKNNIAKPTKSTYAHTDLVFEQLIFFLSNDCAWVFAWSLPVDVHFEIGAIGAIATCPGKTILLWKLVPLLTSCKGASYGLAVHGCKFSHHSVSENNQTIFLCNYLLICRSICQFTKLDYVTMQNTSWEGYQSPLFLCLRFLWWIIKKNWTG